LALQVSIAEADRHDTSAIYTKKYLSNLETEIPGFDWRKYVSLFVQTELKPDEPIVTYASSYLQDMVTVINQTERRLVNL